MTTSTYVAIVVLILFHTLFAQIERKNYQGEKIIDTLDVSIKIFASNETDSVQIDIEGPENVWFGVAFNPKRTWIWSNITADWILKTETDDTYAIIVYKNLLPTVNVEEYVLNNNTFGKRLNNTSLRISETHIMEENERIKVILKRDRYDSETTYQFPDPGDGLWCDDFEGNFDASFNLYIIAAIGTQRIYTTNTTFNVNGSLFETNIFVDDSSVLDPDDCEYLDECFDSESYVFMYPNYERKKIDNLEIYDKILIYDYVNNKYIWDEILLKLHSKEDEFVNDVLIPMIEFTLENNETLTTTFHHLIYVNEGNMDYIKLYRADNIKIGNKLKQFDGTLMEIISIKQVYKYPRNLLTYNGNLVINGFAISSFTDTIWGEHKYWGQSLRFIMNYFGSYNIWRYPAFYMAKIWNEYIPVNWRRYVIRFYFGNQPKSKQKNTVSYWYSCFLF